MVTYERYCLDGEPLLKSNQIKDDIEKTRQRQAQPAKTAEHETEKLHLNKSIPAQAVLQNDPFMTPTSLRLGANKGGTVVETPICTDRQHSIAEQKKVVPESAIQVPNHVPVERSLKDSST